MPFHNQAFRTRRNLQNHLLNLYYSALKNKIHLISKNSLQIDIDDIAVHFPKDTNTEHFMSPQWSIGI